MFLHYMAPNWGAPEEWTNDYSSLAYSADEGQTWYPVPWQWAGDGNLGQVAFTRSDGYVYLFGGPAGRGGGVCLARVPADPEQMRNAGR